MFWACKNLKLEFYKLKCEEYSTRAINDTANTFYAIFMKNLFIYILYQAFSRKYKIDGVANIEIYS